MSDEELSLEEAILRTRSLEHELAEAHGALSAIARERNTWARQLADAKDAALNAEQEVEKARSYAADVSNDRDELTVALEELLHRTVEAGFDTIPVDMLRREIARWERSGVPGADDE